MSERIRVLIDPSKARLSEQQGLAYSAGFFDGEGCVHIARQLKRGARRGHIFRLTVTLAQNHLQSLVDFQCLTGVEGRIYRRARSGSTNRDHYTLNYDGEAAARLLDRLRPYLHRKADEADVALLFQNTCHINRHFGPGGCPAAVWKRRERLYLKLRNLK